MEQTGEKGLFEMKVSDSGKIFIRKFVSLVRPIILLSILISLLTLAGVLIHAIKIDPRIYGNQSLLLFEHNIMPYYMTIYTMVLFANLYYYWKTAGLLTKA